MANLTKAIAKGLKNYASALKYQVTHNTAAEAYDSAKQFGGNPVKAAAKTAGAGSLLFLAPPVVIGMSAVREYNLQRQAEAQASKIQLLTDALKSHGISPIGSLEIATQIISGSSTDRRISTADFKMFMVVASVISPELAEFVPRIADRQESQKPAVQLA